MLPDNKIKPIEQNDNLPKYPILFNDSTSPKIINIEEEETLNVLKQMSVSECVSMNKIFIKNNIKKYDAYMELGQWNELVLVNEKKLSVVFDNDGCSWCFKCSVVMIMVSVVIIVLAFVSIYEKREDNEEDYENYSTESFAMSAPLLGIFLSFVGGICCICSLPFPLLYNSMLASPNTTPTSKKNINIKCNTVVWNNSICWNEDKDNKAKVGCNIACINIFIGFFSVIVLATLFLMLYLFSYTTEVPDKYNNILVFIIIACVLLIIPFTYCLIYFIPYKESLALDLKSAKLYKVRRKYLLSCISYDYVTSYFNKVELKKVKEFIYDSNSSKLIPIPLIEKDQSICSIRLEIENKRFGLKLSKLLNDYLQFIKTRR